MAPWCLSLHLYIFSNSILWLFFSFVVVWYDLTLHLGTTCMVWRLVFHVEQGAHGYCCSRNAAVFYHDEYMTSQQVFMNDTCICAMHSDP